ncbi:MAG: hypothetical protein IAF00_06705 [Phycisphaerales bacterium]|nr:hypothetical protein [Phycisphaerales bacterium]
MRIGSLFARKFWLPSLILLLGLYATGLRAASIPPEVLTQIPASLQPWMEWVLSSTPDRRCPVYYNQTDRYRCVWLSALNLNLNAQGGEFSQKAYNDIDSWLILPGKRGYWPQEVRLDGQTVPVLERDGRPALKAFPGEHQLTGRFYWSALPDSIDIPPENALLDLRLNDQPVPVSQFEDGGVLRLRQRPATPAQQDTLDLQVFRLLTDGIPFMVETRLELRVSGQVREELVGPVLPSNFLPLALDSPLPARLEADGRLRLQLRPGNWTLTLHARHQGPLNSLTLPDIAAPWPQQEIWSFQAQNALRQVTVEGAVALDPAQTKLPESWRQWPAWLLQMGETLRFQLRQRGESEPAPAQLKLERMLWLDFSGQGYTVRDRLSGSLDTTRLDVTPVLQLGRVEIGGEDQFITQSPGQKTVGVEIRQLNDLQLTADSRLKPADIERLPAVGWNIAPRSIDATLNLPPGWRLLAADGPDRTGNAWLYSWNLRDLFIVLVIAFGFAKLWGWPWGVVALIGMTLNYHEPNVPLYIWLNVLVAIALPRVLPQGRVRTLARIYRGVALLALLAIGAMFAVQQVRSALHPQLEPFRLSVMSALSGLDSAPLPETASVASRFQQSLKSEGSLASNKKSQWLQQAYNANIRVQTGPGVPDWRWRQATLRWSGPVAADEPLRLWLLPPWGTRMLMLAGLLLLLAMGARTWIAGRRDEPPAASPSPDQTLPQQPAPDMGTVATTSTVSTALMVLAVLAALVFAAVTPPAQAQEQGYPSLQLLQQLRERLTQPPDCQRCGDLAAMALTLEGDDLRLRLSLQAQTETAVPLPLPPEGLIVRTITLDGQPATLFRDAKRLLWLRLPSGLHTAAVIATVPPEVSTLQLPLPLPPGRLELNISGWKTEGYVEGRIDPQLQLTRPRQDTAAPLQPGVIPPFARIERDIVLDVVDWQVITRVQRLSQANQAAVLEIPLLPGEHVTTPEIRTQDDRVLLNLPSGQTEAQWTATLDRSDRLILQATGREDLVEVWQLHANPLWHVQSAGIPLVQRVDADGQWTPEWRPWPGEQVSLSIDRPEGAPGDTVTIDRSALQLNPGRRLSEASLDLSIRASRGGDHVLTLPPDATLTEARINNTVQPLRQQGQQVILPLVPGTQRVVLNWRQQLDFSTRYTTPVVNLGSPSVNSNLNLNLPRDRWLLWASGPVMGPAVLFWGVLAVILIGAIILGRYSGTPLRAHHWFLLGIGLSQSHIAAILLVAGWLWLLGWRKALAQREIRAFRFDLLQLALVGLTAVALVALFSAIEQGLLGSPEMQVAGNRSSAWNLNWYQDRLTGPLPVASVVSIPLLWYRGLMLAWALWLAFALLKWLVWGWQCFSAGGLWRRLLQSQET